MSCAFGEIVFGWPWTEDMELYLRELTDEEREEIGIFDFDTEGEATTDDAQALGFETFYSASGSGVYGYLGVKLDDINVYTPTAMSEFNMTPTPEQEKLVEEKRAQLPQKIVAELGPPKVWLVWGDT